ncbi:hypothetical protein J2X69_002528 [Algoriphagus sp. 4150]|uniref:hypothetical protein n=1 Tax=Algoriphagus sp. 4150 TaxID=2817756 RepID=UPI0028625A2C|nr:hypothetical protein [Algoriphagus sp. 4150]MDR7130180.1 hypothetical protein [Algoriphagus sp. 4150]
MATYKIGYIDEQEAERIDFQNLMEDDEDDIVVELFEVTPETSMDDLLNQILDSDIECLVVDYHLSETGVRFEGSDLIEVFHEIRPYFPKIIYTAKEDKVIPEVENEIIYMINDKSIKQDEKRSNDFRMKLKTLINNYQQDIDEAKTRLEELTEKKKAYKISIDEENELFIHKKFLIDLDSRRTALPEVLNTQEYLSSLKETNLKVDEILKRIKDA